MGYCQHIKYILNSKLLLDEDLESILIDYVDNEEKPPKISIFEALTGGVVAAASLVVLRLYNVGYEAFILSPFVIFGVNKICGILYKQRQRRNVQNLVDCLASNLRLHREICNYFKSREERVTKSQNFDPYAPKIARFFTVVKPVQTSIFVAVKKHICDLINKVPRLQQMYGYVGTLDPEILSQLNEEDCIAHHSTLQHSYDVFVLLTSHFLACLGIVLCPDHCETLKINEIIDTQTLDLKNVMTNSINIISDEFNSLKFFYLKKEESGLPKHHSEISKVSKLGVQTLNAMSHTSEIVEKAKFITNYVTRQEAEMGFVSGQELLGDYIQDLGNHLLLFYEELQMLHKRYEISVKRSEAIEPEVEPVSIPDLKSKSEIEEKPLIAEDCEMELTDEVYELDLNDEFSDKEDGEVPNSQAGLDEQERLSALVAMELNQKVKQHSRFLHARKRRGEPETDADVSRNDLPASTNAKPSSLGIQNHEPQDLTMSMSISTPSVAPPPPPPPLPTSDVNNLPPLEHITESFLPETRSTIGKNLSDKLRVEILRRGPIHEEVFDYSDD